MFSIKFNRNSQKDCTQVTAEIDTGLPVELHIITLRTERSNQISSELLLRHLRNEYHNLIEDAHRKAYEQGFKDGRQRKKKKTWFRRQFCDHNQNPCR